MARAGNNHKGGRPKGAKTLIKAIDYFNEDELRKFWADLKERAKTSEKIALYFAEQFTGKPMQAMELTGKDGKDLIPDSEVKIKIDDSINSFISSKNTEQE
jgi:transcriptional regulator of met regulon